MATTTNYGWTTPDDTALVKDGAAAIRTLGSSVDTTTKALNPSTTLGDIEYRSSTANTNTRLPIGSSGQLLSVSGGVPAWTTFSGGGMTLLSTTTLSGSSTTISSINQSYKALKILVRDADCTDVSTIFGIRFNGVTSGSYYYSATTSKLVFFAICMCLHLVSFRIQRRRNISNIIYLLFFLILSFTRYTYIIIPYLCCKNAFFIKFILLLLT